MVCKNIHKNQQKVFLNFLNEDHYDRLVLFQQLYEQIIYFIHLKIYTYVT
jgi:hypothetical protein